MDRSTAASYGDLVTGGGRNLEELKQEVWRRVERGIMPLGGIAPEDARSALAAIDSLDREQWAKAWSSVAEQHFAKAQALEAGDRKGAAAEYWHAWRLHHFARWPVENTPAKRHAKQRALDAFGRYCRLLDPVIEVVRIPFEGKEIVAYLRRPAGPRPVPVVLGIAGLDSRKEDVAAYTDRYLKHGVAMHRGRSARHRRMRRTKPPGDERPHVLRRARLSRGAPGHRWQAHAGAGPQLRAATGRRSSPTPSGHGCAGPSFTAARSTALSSPNGCAPR